jgi:histidinol-phosphate aminotransferase
MQVPSASGATMLKVREAVRKLPLYNPPLASREGLRLDFNENTSGCSPRVIDHLRHLGMEQLVKYPERGRVESQVASFLRVRPEEILLTNGVDEAIHLLCETYLKPGDEALIVVPTYSMYRIYAMATGARAVCAFLDTNFKFSLENVIAGIGERTRFVAIANPNNPTGTIASQETLVKIAQAAENAAVLIDEAYFEFYGQTMLDSKSKSPNLFVARTFSKAYGMAGLRVGALVGDAEQMNSVRRIASPYNVNAIALACLPAAIDDQEYIRLYVADVLESRGRLERVFLDNGIQFWHSEANFVMARLGSSADGAARFVERMRYRGILVRDRSSDDGCVGCIRVTVGVQDQTDRLIAALRETFEELGITQGIQC